jgi:anti-anti-sigma factor
VVDLSELYFIDSSGLRELVAAKISFTETGQELVLTRPQPNAERIFAITGLDGLIGLWRQELRLLV